MDLEESDGGWIDDRGRRDSVTRSNGPLDGPNGIHREADHGKLSTPILNEDILLIVLDLLLDRHETRHTKSVELISIDRRVNLSQESFNLPSNEPTGVETVGNLRLVCKAFNELGAPYLLPRVTVRFSESGLERLENIAKSPILSKSVLKFSYMVPYFFQEGKDQLSRLSAQQLASLSRRLSVPADRYQLRIQERKRIVESQRDFEVLRLALGAFKNLQHVQLLRLQDQSDGQMIQFCHDAEVSQAIRLDYNGAYLRSIIKIAEALVISNSPCNRFSSPHIDAGSAMVFASDQLQFFRVDMPHILRKLTSLELMFTAETNVEEQVKVLAGQFNHVLKLAVNLKSFHLGFGGNPVSIGRPVEIGFDDIFYDLKWKSLTVFGIDGWRVDARDITDLTMRHRDKLKGLRLRNVYLNDGSKWEDVLLHLKLNLNLNWVSLKGIGYTSQFHALPRPENLISNYTSSEDTDGSENETEDDEDDAGDDDDHQADGQAVHTEPEDSDDEVFTARVRQRRDTGLSIDFTSIEAESLGDNGRDVSAERRRAWQKWVTCTARSY